MKRPLIVLGLILHVFASCSKSTPESSKEMVLWYDNPASDVWLDGLLLDFQNGAVL